METLGSYSGEFGKDDKYVYGYTDAGCEIEYDYDLL
jgi:hypothetical protein